MLKEAKFYDKLYQRKNNIDFNLNNLKSRRIVQCNLCRKHCKILNNEYGFCMTRKNIGGILYSLNYPKIASYNVDSIEKKPLYHFLVGSKTFSIGGFGCNFSCLNCQNYILATNSYNEDNSIKILPEMIVQNAIDEDCQSISWTYNEPTLYFEFAEETSLIAHEKNLKNIFVSNGYMTNEALVEILKFIDGFNIDLKSFSNDFYKNICGGQLNPILDNLKTIYDYGAHLEITNLLINDLNTDYNEIKAISKFILNELGPEVPIHFSRFFPQYKMRDKSPTNIEYLLKSREIAKDIGLEYVYLGNMESDNNSYCPNCGEILISRNSYFTNDLDKIENGHCINCGYKLNFILD